MTAVGIRTADPRHTLQIVAAGAKPLADLLDTLKAIPAVGGGGLLLVVLAEPGEMAFKDGMEFVATTRNVLVPRRGRKRDCRPHIIVYERNQLLASERELVHRSHVQPGPLSHLTRVTEMATEVTTKIQQNLTVYMAHMRKRAGRTVITLHTDRI